MSRAKVLKFDRCLLEMQAGSEGDAGWRYLQS